MKTTLIKVDRSDDFLTLKDRIGWSDSERVLLILPAKRKKFPDEHELVLLDRAAKVNGAQLGIVTRKKHLQEAAKKKDINVFSSVAQAERLVWRKSDPLIGSSHRMDIDALVAERNRLPKETSSFPKLHISKPVLISILLAVMLVVVVVFLPSATVIIYPDVQLQEQVFEIHAATSISQPELTGWIPAVEKRFTLTGEMSAESTGNIKIGENRASGEVEVTNLTGQEIELPRGTQFTTALPGIQKYATTQDVSVPGDGSIVSIPIEAVEADESGNVGEGEIVYLEGLAGSSLSVRNSEPITGGSSLSLSSPSEEDYNRLSVKIINELREKALAQSITAQPAELMPITESLTLDKVISESRDTAVGEAGDTLSMSLTAVYRILYYNPTELAGLMNDVMDVSIPEGFQAAEDSLHIEQLGNAQIIEKNEVAWKIRAVRSIIDRYSQMNLKKAINGRSIQRATELVNDLIPQYRSAEVVSMIGWWPYLPLLPDRIDFEERFQDGK